MNKGIINESLLPTDIEQIEMYSTEENEVLEKIHSACKEALSTYVSSNTSMINSHLSSMPNDANRISRKRVAYANTLKTVIQRYHLDAAATKRKFEEYEG